MNEAAAVALGVLALVVVVGLPMLIYALVGRQTASALAAVSEWATSKGLSPTAASAAALVHPQVPVVSFGRDLDVFSFAFQASARRNHFAVYLRPREGSALPPLALQRRMWGGGGEALGDPQLDEHFALLHGDGSARALVARSEIREALLVCADELAALNVHEGVVIATCHLRESVDTRAWDRALTLVQRVARAAAAGGAS